MSRSTIAICKFVGSISLGLLTVRHPSTHPFLLILLPSLPRTTHVLHHPHHQQQLTSLPSSIQGVSYTLSTLTLPSLLSLPSATTAHTTFLRLQTLAKTHVRSLSALATTTLVLAYALAPRRGRHPYLLWTALTVALSGGVDFALRLDEEQLRRTEEGEGGGVNGEMVRKGMERFRVAQAVRAAVAGCGFVMSVVGIWGDGF